MRLLMILTTGYLLSGCATNINTIDVKGRDPACVRECAQNYSSCVSGGSHIGIQTELLSACANSYKVCTQTCPIQSNKQTNVIL